MISIKNKKWKNIITLSALGFLLILSFEILPRLYNIASLSFDLISQKFRIESNEKKKDLINDLTIRNKQLTWQISSIVSDYKKNRNISDVITLFDSVARKCDIHISDIKPLQIIKSNNLWMQPLDITLSSNYESVYNYINILEHSAKVILLKKMSLIKNKESDNIIDVKIHFEIYLNI